MSKVIEITSLADEALTPYVRLTEAQLKNRLHPEDGLFIAESPVVIGYALDAGYAPVSFLMERRHVAGKAAALLERCPDAPVYTADADVLQALTGYPLTRGVLCAMRRRPLPAVEDVLKGARGGWRCWRASWTPPTSARSSARRRRWAWTRCC